jgi:DNA invertase Pin-like site-specific DNA recombinase
MYTIRMDKNTNQATAQRIGYARVSSGEQEMDLQLDALAKSKCDRVFSEKVSSSKAERPQLTACLETLRVGDILTVWRLDRLGRSVTELVAIVTQLKARGVAFESLTERIDTTSASGEFTFHLFAALAQFERNIIQERTRAGLKAARARGRVGGRKPKVTAQTKREMQALYDSNSVSVIAICERYDITRGTFYRAVLGRTYKSTESKI